MKKSRLIIQFAAILALGTVGVSNSFAQADLGADCGCPPVASRPNVLLSTLATSGGANDGDLTATTTILDCSKNWILDKKIYVPDGKTIVILPGTVIKGNVAPNNDPAQATALVVERGAKILAAGEPDCQIVFTAAADPLDGTFPIKNKGQWGGLVILGRATNNQTTGGTAVQPGVGFVEGFVSADSRNLYGMPTGTADDNDNSGILRYVSVRFAGAILPPGNGNELNGISLGSVGRGTIVEHVEVIAAADDNIEFFGGTVNVKYVNCMFGNDDMFDFDLGYKGKVQFYFSIKSSTNDTIVTSPEADNGFECDADDSKSNAWPRSHPVMYNVTMIGNNKRVMTVDNSGIAAIMAKELTEGEFYNSVFANFKGGLNMWKQAYGRPATTDQAGNPLVEAYDNWMYNDLIVKNNTFIGCTKPVSIDKYCNGTASAADFTKFANDGNLTPASIPGFTYIWSMDGTTNAVSTKFSAVPAPGLSTTINPPSDGFFSPAPYRGAFKPGVKSWLSDWSYAMLLNNTTGLSPCPTDINQDGATNVDDFLQLLGNFGQSCQ
ncbi:MAG: hypothetical protein WCO63_09610 [Bacteroidota bacterium]